MDIIDEVHEESEDEPKDASNAAEEVKNIDISQPKTFKKARNALKKENHRFYEVVNKGTWKRSGVKRYRQKPHKK
jgi:hypothetical protein